jgi:serine/threonine protein kinase/Flp pilus assembly protein TadD
MKPDKWQNIETIFHQALNLSAAARQKYLAEACAGNREMLGEIESLLSSFEQESNFLEQPAFSLGMKILENNVDVDLTGQTMGFYTILEKIGSGGMGDVYLAEDTKLNRKVALKFLSTALADNNWAKRQLIKEAQAVAMLDHPNICAVYGIEEIGEHTFIVMKHIQGETLSNLIRQGFVPNAIDTDSVEENPKSAAQTIEEKQLLSISEQITSALVAAHEHGIIHRDIKAGNIMITPGGQVKVLDFGLAKIIKQPDNLGESLSLISQKGLIVGTVACMSPEQLRAENLDFRTDIFSLGTVLYELAAGKHPFLENSNAETISAILTKQPEPITTLQNGNSAGFNRVIKRCLEKNKENRYQSAIELFLEIQSLQKKKPSKIKSLNHLNLLIASLVIIILIIVGTVVYRRATKPRTLAILPFINQTADPNYEYMTGMADTLFNKLSASSKLNVKPLTQTANYSSNDPDPVKLGKILDVEAILTGKIIERNNQIFLDINLISTSDGGQLLGETQPLAVSEILNIQNNISEQIISKLQSPLSNNNKKFQSTDQTENPQAYEFYLKGLNFWKKRADDKENIKRARDTFYQAAELDPNYARAYTGLAYVYIVKASVNYDAMHPEEAINLARYNAQKAIELDENLCEAHAALGAILSRYEWKWAEAEKEYKRAIELNPDIAQTYYWYSELLVANGRYDEALETSRKAQELDPANPVMYLNVGRILYFARRYDEAEKQLTEALAIKDFHNIPGLKNMLGFVYLETQRKDEAVKIFQEIQAKDKAFTAALGYTYGKTGRMTEAYEMLNQLEELEKKQDHLPAHEKALVYIGLGEKDKALSELQKAYQERFYGLGSLNVNPIYDSLRGEAKFQKLLEDLNLKKPI